MSKNRQKAFKKYLGKNGRLFVPSQWCSMSEAVEVITGSRGIAVLAHPGRYPLSRSKLLDLVRYFSSVGGDAIEVSYGNIDPLEKKRLTELAETEGLYISIGSDFHDAEAHWTNIGKAPSLNDSDKKNAIWNHPRWHFD